MRGYNVDLTRKLFGKKPERGSLEAPDVPASLWVKSRLPESLSLSLLKSFVRDLAVEWRSPPFKNIQREAASSAFVELFLRREERMRLLARWSLGQLSPGSELREEASEVIPAGRTLSEWLLESRVGIAQRGTNLYVVPSPQSLLFLDEEVLKPLVRLTRESTRPGFSLSQASAEIDALRGPARALQYEILLHRDAGTGGSFVVLGEIVKNGARQHWGTYVCRLGLSGEAAQSPQPYVIEVPHPDYEENTIEYGVSLFEKLDAGFLLIAGSHPKCNTDGSADVVVFENRRSVFNLVHQVILRESGEEPLCAVQVRALGYRPGVGLPDADALLAFSDASSGEATLSDLGTKLANSIKQDGVSVRFVDGSRATSGYEVFGSAQALYLPHTRNKECCGLWLSPFIRWGYRQYSESSLQDAQFVALGIDTSESDLPALLATSPQSPLPVPDALTSLLRRYRATQDINILHSIQRQWSELELSRVMEKSLHRAFLLVRSQSGILPLVMSLTPPLVGREEAQDLKLEAAPTLADLKRLVELGACFLGWGNTP